MRASTIANSSACHIDDGLSQAIVDACLLPDSGARNIDSLFNQQILPVLSQQLLQRQASQRNATAVTLGYSADDGIALAFSEEPLALERAEV